MNSEIILLGTNLSEGESLRTICPVCRGGTSEERSLSITKDGDGLVWQCFRATCGVSGATNRVASSKSQQKRLTVQKPTWEGTTYELPTKVKDRVQTLWGITDPPHWYWTTDFGGRVAMSVRSPQDTHRGWVLRALTPARTKVLNYMNSNEESLSWYKTSPYASTVLVEDIPSALRASKYVNSVALLGTGVGFSRATEIAENTSQTVIVALDQDAIDLSFKWAKKYKLMWGDVKVLPLKKDMKNMTEQDLRELLT